MTLIFILLAVFAVSLISLVGIFTFSIKPKMFDKLLVLMIGFAAGGLTGSAFLHLLPEAIEKCSAEVVFVYTLIGFTVFFFMERYFYWRHCHNGKCNVHTFTYLNLIGDGVHNFTDGLIIAASFVTDTKLGIVTTLAVLLHEIPQEMGDFGILVYGGYTKSRALFFNFMCALSAFLGAILGYIISGIAKDMTTFLISFTAGGFIYIAASDLIPELHRQEDIRKANISFVAFVAGLIFMALSKFIG